jgi:hypothetical protein
MNWGYLKNWGGNLMNPSLLEYENHKSNRTRMDEDSRRKLQEKLGMTKWEQSKMPDTENWYILCLDDVEEKIHRVSSLGIPCLDISKSYSSPGIAFPAISVKQVLDCLGTQSYEYSLEPTNMGSTFVMKLHEDNEICYSEERPMKNFESWDSLIPVMKTMYDLFGVRIIPDNPHGHPSPPIPLVNENDLYVRFWSTPGVSAKAKTKIDEVFGIKLVENQMDAFEASGVGIELKDYNGKVFAEYVNDNLYVLFDLPHSNEGGNVTEVFTRIMSSYLTLKGKTETELRNFHQMIMGVFSGVIIANNSRDQFVKECSKLYVKNLKSMEDSLRAYDLAVDEYNQKLIQAMRDRDVLLVKLEPLKESNEKRKEWAYTEYDTLCATPHVKDVKVIGKVIHVYTDMISITHGYNTYNIGEFRIEINTDGSNSSVKAINLTKPLGGLSHPHIHANGKCCLGNIEKGVSKLLAEYQYVILAQLMITYLQSYNPDSAYGRVELWR